MLKQTADPDERRGAHLMVWWNGSGAAHILAHDVTTFHDTLLMERAHSPRTLADLTYAGHDNAASLILCQTAARLHAARTIPPPELIPLATWFKALTTRHHETARLNHAAEIARSLLNDSQDVIPLHGDLHHTNILDFGPSGWKAIDPKALSGERYFDYTPFLLNPDLACPTRSHAAALFDQRLQIITHTAHLNPDRLLRWTLAMSALSACWSLHENQSPALALTIAGLAASRLA